MLAPLLKGPWYWAPNTSDQIVKASSNYNQLYF
jgi:hypothetical protein